MKKLLLSIILLIITSSAFAQKDSIANAVKVQSEAIGHNGNNEIKVNLLYLVLGLPEVSYERLIADNMGIGATATFGIEDDQDMKYFFLAHYRLYFGNKKANGFFIEGNMGVITEQRDTYYYNPETSDFYRMANKTHAYFGMGAAAGAKFLTRNGFLGEAYLGAGRMFGDSYNEVYPRIGITLGKRF